MLPRIKSEIIDAYMEKYKAKKINAEKRGEDFREEQPDFCDVLDDTFICFLQDLHEHPDQVEEIAIQIMYGTVVAFYALLKEQIIVDEMEKEYA